MIPAPIQDLIDHAADEGCLELSELSAVLENSDLPEDDVHSRRSGGT